MATMTFEWWGIDEDGNKYHEYITTKRTRINKVKKEIEIKYNFSIDKFQDFGIRKHIE